MNLSDITNRITFFTGVGTTQYTNADRLIAINKAYNDIHTMILQSQDEWDFDDSNKTDFPILQTNLMADQQDYAMPSDTLKVKRAEITYDGTNYYKLEPFDIEERGLATDTNSIAGSFNVTEPKYAISAGSIFLYPIPGENVTNGLKLWIFRTVDEFTSAELTTGTAEPGFDRQFHYMISLQASYDFISKRTKDQGTADRILRDFNTMEQRLKQYYGNKQTDRVYSLRSAFVNYS